MPEDRTAAHPGGLTLHLERLLRARRARVFAASVDPDELAAWWGPRGFTVPAVELDVRVGGRYRIAMQPPEGDLFHLAGEFREVDAPARLAYTFRWEEAHPDDRETLVTLSFAERGEATLLAVDQGVFATKERRALHVQGWTETLERLEGFLSP